MRFISFTLIACWVLLFAGCGNTSSTSGRPKRAANMESLVEKGKRFENRKAVTPQKAASEKSTRFKLPGRKSLKKLLKKFEARCEKSVTYADAIDVHLEISKFLFPFFDRAAGEKEISRLAKIVRESVRELTWKEMRDGKLALIRPVRTSTEGRCVARMR